MPSRIKKNFTPVTATVETSSGPVFHVVLAGSLSLQPRVHIHCYCVSATGGNASSKLASTVADDGLLAYYILAFGRLL